MWRQMTLKGMDNYTSSLELEDGLTQQDLLVGPMINQCGRDHAHVNHSALREKEKAMKMKGICGPSSQDSLGSANLQSFLENKLREVMDVNGSMEYVLTWKKWDMQSGPQICALRASALHTLDKDCGGLPTLTVQDGNGRDRHNQRNGTVILSLLGIARRFPTLIARDARSIKGAARMTKALGTEPLCVEVARREGKENGYLNPIFCAWLMGYPKTHLLCAPTVTRLFRKLRQKS